MSLSREAHSCNLIEDCRGNKQVVVVGGWSPDVLHDEYGYNGTTINSTEIYDVTTGVWSEGNQLLLIVGFPAVFVFVKYAELGISQ